MHSFTRNLVLVFSLIFLLSCGSGSFNRMNSAGNSLDGQDVWLVNKDTAAENAAMFELRRQGDDSGLKVDIVTRTAGSLSQILLELHYDNRSLSVDDVDMKHVLGPAEEKVVFIHTDYPGLVAIGEARIGLTEIDIPAGALCVTVKFVRTPDARQVSSIMSEHPNRAGVKLRLAREFTNVDKNFNAVINNKYVHLEWEEALDGDYNGNSEVNVSDITPIAVCMGYAPDNYLIQGGDEFTEDFHESGGNLILHTATIGERTLDQRLRLRRVSMKGDQAAQGDFPPDSYTAGDDHAPVIRGDLGEGKIPGSIYYYEAYSDDITLIGQNFSNSVKGYELLLFAGHPNPNPAPSGEDTPNGNFIILKGWLERPSGSQLDPPEYSINLNLNRFYGTLFGNAYIAVRPVGFSETHVDSDVVVTNGDPGPFTYWYQPIDFGELPDPPPVPTWDGDVGIRDIQIGSEYGAANNLEFRALWGTASLPFEWMQQGYQVGYAVYFEFDPSQGLPPASVFIDGEDGLPQYKYYPYGDNRGGHSPKMYDVIRGAIGGMQVPAHLFANNKTITVGVRTYGFKDLGLGMIHRGPMDENMNVQSEALSDVIPDEIAPNFAGVDVHAKTFSVPWALMSEEEWGSMWNEDKQDYDPYPRLQAMFLPHALDPQQIGLASYIMIPVNLTDLEDFGGSPDNPIPSPDSELELRLEFYRTNMPKKEFFWYIEHYGILQWLDDPTPAREDGLMYWREEEPFCISLEWPDFGPEHLYHVENPLEQGWETWWLPLAPPYNMLDFQQYYPIPEDKQVRLNQWTPDEPLEFPETDFTRENDFIRFVYNSSLEYHDDNRPGVDDGKVAYVAVAAVNDEANNCTYDNSEPLFGVYCGQVDKGVEPDDYVWVELAAADAYTEWLYTGEYPYEYPKFSASVGITAETIPQARYPDIAFHAGTNTLGVSYFRAEIGKVYYTALNLTGNSGTTGSVQPASEGDTSLAFDAMGNPHIAYYAIDWDGDGIIEPDPSFYDSHQSSSVSYTSGVYYTMNDGLEWTPRETVDESSIFSMLEHDLHILGPSAGNAPYCIVPTFGMGSGEELGIPGYSLREGLDDWETDELTTNASPTNFYLDSIQVDEGGRTVTYVAIYDMSNLPAGSISLGKYDNGSWVITPPLDMDVIGGYQSLVKLPSGNIGISYMAGDDKHLRYGEWNGASFVQLFDSQNESTGYQTAVSFDTFGNPVIYSLNKTEGKLWRVHFDGTEWNEEAIMEAAVSDAIIDKNTVSVVRLPGPHNQTAVAWIGYLGDLLIGVFNI